MEFKKENKKRLYENIVEKIKELINEGSLAPGDQLLSERELAQQFKVSRTAIREAHKVLSSQGYVEVRQGGGVYVKDINDTNNEALVRVFADVLYKEKEDIVHILEIRKVLEIYAVRKAIAHATVLDLLNIEKNAYEAYEDLINNKMTDSDTNFHASLAEASHNPILVELNRLLITITREVYFEVIRREVLKEGSSREVIARQHIDLYEAIKARKTQDAVRLIKQHIDLSGKVIL